MHFVTKCHTLNFSQKSHFCRLFLRKYYFRCYARFVTAYEGRNKDRFKNCKLYDFENTRFYRGATKLTQNYVSFRNPCNHLFFPTSVTREYHRNVLRYLNFTCCSIFPLTCRIYSFGRFERRYTFVFLGMVSVLAWMHAAQNKRILKALVKICKQYQIFRKKQRVSSAVPNSDTLLYSAVIAYANHRFTFYANHRFSQQFECSPS